MDALLTVNDLKTYFFTDRGQARAVDGVSFQVDKGETLGIVGESGCGKSVTGLSIMRLIQQPPGRILSGSIRFRARELLTLPGPEMRNIRGNDISMIFQEPLTSLNPVFPCGSQIEEAIRGHEHVSKSQARQRTLGMLDMTGIPNPEYCYRAYPHHLSGGMRQRVMIAMALVCRPELLIADEPTTALDVTVQAQILRLIRNLQAQFGMTVILISHDLGVIAEMADHLLVMYAGKIVEFGSVKEVFANPLHPYTQGLLQSVPKLHQPAEKLAGIPGAVPSAENFPAGCRFHPRCPFNDGEICGREEPAFHENSTWNHTARCHYITTEGDQLVSPHGLEKRST
ncbi:MAG TPA: ABC transporter ATP-binding protein [bacterium]|nr:ABC transporter ATP-binding protein [bacterium]